MRGSYDIELIVEQAMYKANELVDDKGKLF
jgi:hypothetical protein